MDRCPALPRRALVGIVATAVVAAIGLSGAGPSLAATAGSPTVAPYMDMGGPNQGNLSAGISAGLSDVTAAFVIGKKCTPIWDNKVAVAKDTAVTNEISAAQSAGADVIVSFGGAGGKDLARTCSNVNALTDAYQSVIVKFDITHVDFDVEGKAIKHSQLDSMTRRFAAIRGLESEDPNLFVSVTIGVGPDGLPKQQMAFLRLAKRTGTRIDLVNIMAMDYGGAVGDMGATAVQAAQDTLPQLQSLWPSSTYADLGITPMIGQNDSAGEVTGLDDARTIVQFADANGVGRLAFWSLNRDQECSQSLDGARDDCSGVDQTPLQFTSIFLGND
jgi:chitinase